MKITPSFQSGNALLAGLITASILGATLASYLVLVSSQNTSITRAQSWNMAVPVAEAGVDEALANLNYNTNRNTSGWAAGSPYDFSKTNALNDGSSNYYVVGISNMTAPIVVARGFVPMPNASGFISRTIRVTTRRSGMLQMAMLARGSITMGGNGVETDSYDSTDPRFSDNGAYPLNHPERTRDHGDIGTNAGLLNSMNVGNANISGKAATGSGGVLEIGPNGLVGSAQFQTNAAYRETHHDPSNPQVEAGYFTDDMNVTIDDVTPPWSATTLTDMPEGGTVNGERYNYVLYNNHNYQLSSFSGKMLVLGNATLLVTQDFTMTGQDILRIGPNASLKLYVAAPTASIGGQGVVNNGGSPTNFWYYGLPSNTTLNFSGNGTFTGIIYAPNADFKLSGGGSGDQDFSGASVTRTVSMQGHFKFHYDESLGRLGANGIHRITSWTEVPNPASASL